MDELVLQQCLEDTGLKRLITECLGEEAANATCAYMIREFNDSAAIWCKEGYARFAEALDSRRRLFEEAGDADVQAFYKECYRRIYSLQRIRKPLENAGTDHQTRRVALLQIARELLEFRRRVAETAAMLPEKFVQTPSAVLTALLEYPHRHEKDLRETEALMQPVQRGLHTLPYIKLHFTNQSGTVSQCSLEMTGQIPARADASKAGVTELPELLMQRLQQLRPDLFRAIDRFCNDFAAIYPRCLDDLTQWLDRLEYALNAVQILTFLRRHGVPLCRAKLGLRQTTELIDACDISLLLLRRDYLNRTVVPNTVTLRHDQELSLLLGPGGSGKTSYLKAVAGCHLFFMLGLPVPATMGTVAPVREIRLYLHGLPPAKEIEAAVGGAQGGPGNPDKPDKLDKPDKPDKPLDDVLILALLTNMTLEGNDFLPAIPELQAIAQAGGRGICALRSGALSRGGEAIPDSIPLSMPIWEAYCDHDGKRTFQVRAIHRGEDPRVSEILARYGLNKSSLLPQLNRALEKRIPVQSNAGRNGNGGN